MLPLTDFFGNTHAVYTTTEDYITENITPGLGDITLTDEQAHEVAHIMLIPFEMHNAAGIPTYVGFIEDPDKGFWDAVAEVLGDN